MLQWRKALSAAQAQVQQTRVDEQTALQKLADSRPELDKLAASEPAEKLRIEHGAMLRARHTLAETTRRLATAKADRQRASLDAARSARVAFHLRKQITAGRHASLNDVLLQAKRVQVTLDEHPHRSKLGEQITAWRSQLEARQHLLDDIDATRKKQRECSETIAKHTNDIEAQRGVVRQSEKALELARKSEADERACLAQTLEGQEEAALKTRCQQLQQQQTVLNRLHQLALTREQGSRQQRADIADLTTHQTSLKDHTDASKRLDDECRVLREQIADKKRLLEQEKVILQLADHRAALREGEACPLCGSHEHPAIVEYQALDASATQRDLDAKEAALHKLVDARNAAEKAIAVSTAAVGHLQKRIDQWTTDEAQHAKDWHTLCAKIEVELHDRASLDAHVERHAAALEQAQETLDRVEKLNGRIARCVDARHAAQTATAGHTRDLAVLGEKRSACEKSLEEAGERIAAHQVLIAQKEQTLDASVAEASAVPPDDWSQWRDWILQRDADWRAWQAATDRSQTLSHHTKADPAGTRRRLAIGRAVDGPMARIRSESFRACVGSDRSSRNAEADIEQAAADHEAMRDRANALDGAETTLTHHLSEHTAAAEKSAESWEAALERSPFGDEAAFAQALLPHDERERLQALEERAREAAHGSANMRASAEKRHDDLLADPKTEQSAETLQQQSDELVSTLGTVNRRQGEIRAALNHDEQQRLSKQALFDAIETQRKQYDLWQRLSSLIGSSDGAKYRKFAQGLTLDHLVYLANRQLTHLHGRYQLSRKVGGDLEMEVVDTWQGDVARDTRTLSGGESFLVSLALALALSDLVSHKTSIDSLFLDEGFGTLDGETLEIALNALDSLNARGKTIGVISHVDALKERIPLQIRVAKSFGVGFSTVEVVAA